jgi:16S rRNA (adenine1518-N6/adenine1519-N6)-dimethyltransferase
LDRIAAAVCPHREPPLREALVIEIGPGRGALTEPLLERALRVIAIEVDTVLVHYLRQKFREALESGRLQILEADVLKTDLGAWGRCAIAGNLPYYITSPILERVFAAHGSWSRAVFLVQAEVAARLAAGPGSRDYGFLSVATQARAQVERLFEVPPEAFKPPPKVMSEVVRLTPRDPGMEDLAGFLQFAGICFRQKRKTLRNNLLSAYGKETAAELVDARVRAEQLSLAELKELFARLKTLRT